MEAPAQFGIDTVKEQDFIRAFRYMMYVMYQINEAHGWHDPEPSDAECVALAHSELSELLEYLRHRNPESDHIKGFTGAEEEAADTVIRLMSWAQRRGWDLAGAIAEKARFNNQRPYKHGGKAF